MIPVQMYLYMFDMSLILAFLNVLFPQSVIDRNQIVSQRTD